jgi:hypothetical protein
LDLLVLFNHLRRIFSFSFSFSLISQLVQINTLCERERDMEEDRVFYPDYLTLLYLCCFTTRVVLLNVG